MAISVQSTLDAIRKRYPDYTETEALADLESCFTEILKDVRLVHENVTLSSIVSGTQTYATAGVLKIWSAMWQESADSTTWVSLLATSIKVLERDDPAFRVPPTQSGSTPTHYFIDTPTTGAGTKAIGLSPIPTVASSGGYPRVVLAVTKLWTITKAGYWPETLESDAVLVDAVCRERAAQLGKTAEEQYWDRKYDRDLGTLREMFEFQANEYNPGYQHIPSQTMRRI